MLSKHLPQPYTWQALLFVGMALWSYFYGINSARMPTIGDEAVYMEIARVTKVSGNWLPLRDERGVWNTKPPLLFWQGMLTTPNDHEAVRWQYRWPSILWTLLLALCLAYFMRSWQGVEGGRWQGIRTGAPIMAAAIYLGFISTYQHGRPFLMHPWEQLGLSVPVFLVLALGWTWPVALMVGLLWGIVALYKSFILIFIGAAALLAVLYIQRPSRSFFKNVMPQLISAGVLALAIFSLWFLLDPNPHLIIEQFILGENAAKLKTGSYWQGLVSGPYPLTRIWLGSLANSGLYLFLIVGLIVFLLRQRRRLSRMDQSLVAFILVFLFIYSIPSQRQENYILPVMVMWAALLAKYWDRIGDLWFRLTGAILVGYGFLTFLVLHKISVAYSEILFGPYAQGVLLVLAVGGLILLTRTSWGKPALPLMGLLFCHSISVVAASFALRIPVDVVQSFEHKNVFVPSNFRYAHTSYRFEFPGANLRGYSTNAEAEQAIADGNIVAIPDGLRKKLVDNKVALTEHFSWPVLRERLTSDEIKSILSSGHYEDFLTPLNFVSK